MTLDTQLTLDYAFLPTAPVAVTANQIELPEGYKGLAAFHKYWGKKPVECLAFLMETLTQPGDVIIDPFVGSGFVGREAVLRGRRFLGIDINPIAVELSRLLLNLPDVATFRTAVAAIEHQAREPIDKTYCMADSGIATHYLWSGETLQSVWRVTRGKGGRDERSPTTHDNDLFLHYEDYAFQCPRPLRSFHNSRINTSEHLTLNDLFTGRARHNIDLLLQAISQQPEEVQDALRLALTSASGQMSRMVFAITGRGKTSGAVSSKIEVGSWVIGYWRPELHFEINVWNCFQHRVCVLMKALSRLSTEERRCLSGTMEDVLNHRAQAAIVEADARDILTALPSECASLILTDPPHSDRIPYLELSAMWNALLGKEPCLEREIVVSNARNRNKTKALYSADMEAVFEQVARVLKPGKYLAVLFNARDTESWNALSAKVSLSQNLCYRGCFPLNYSANSVVQDNRNGSLKTDFVLLYQKGGADTAALPLALQQLPEWSERFPMG